MHIWTTTDLIVYVTAVIALNRFTWSKQSDKISKNHNDCAFAYADKRGLNLTLFNHPFSFILHISYKKSMVWLQLPNLVHQRSWKIVRSNIVFAFADIEQQFKLLASNSILFYSINPITWYKFLVKELKIFKPPTTNALLVRRQINAKNSFIFSSNVSENRGLHGERRRVGLIVILSILCTCIRTGEVGIGNGLKCWS